MTETPAPAPESTPEPTPATPAGTGRPLGRQRGVGFVIVLSIVTLGIYSLYWAWVSFSEVKRYRGEGVGPLVGILSFLILVGYFLLPQYVGKMYSSEGQTNPPVSGLTGFWIFLPYVGGFVWLAKIQGALNRFWQSKGAPAA
jgi:hypothetical protein